LLDVDVLGQTAFEPSFNRPRDTARMNGIRTENGHPCPSRSHESDNESRPWRTRLFQVCVNIGPVTLPIKALEAPWYDACRYAHGHTERGDIPSDHSAGTNDGPVSDRNALEDSRPGAQPNVSPNGYWAIGALNGISIRHSGLPKNVIARHQNETRANHGVVTDGYICRGTHYRIGTNKDAPTYIESLIADDTRRYWIKRRSWSKGPESPY
jgi:hypothetical protein